MKQSLVILLIISLLTFGCNFDTFDRYKDIIHESLQDPKNKEFKSDYNDVDDLRGCDFLLDIGIWQFRDYGSFGRSQSWRRGTLNTETGVSLDLPKEYFKSLISIINNDSYYPIYIGPWQDTVLTKPTPFTLSLTNLFRSDEQKDRKLRSLDYRRTLKIRFFAYQELDSGEIRYSYESMNNKNKKIKSKPFSLSKKSKIAPNRFDLCVVKWTAKFGYNAIAEVKSKNSFSKDYLVPTGRIIEVK